MNEPLDVTQLQALDKGVSTGYARNGTCVLFTIFLVLAHISCRPGDRYKEWLLNRNNTPVVPSNFSVVLLGFVTCTKYEPEPSSYADLGTEILRICEGDLNSGYRRNRASCAQ